LKDYFDNISLQDVLDVNEKKIAAARKKARAKA
jgi:hypothetical protein